MPEWIEKRVQYLMNKNPDMSESTAWGLATDQGRATGKVSKDYGTVKGKRKSKQKYRKPQSAYEHKAKPDKKSALLQGLVVLANNLDIDGHYKEADLITGLIKDIHLQKQAMAQHKSEHQKHVERFRKKYKSGKWIELSLSETQPGKIDIFECADMFQGSGNKMQMGVSLLATLPMNEAYIFAEKTGLPFVEDIEEFPQEYKEDVVANNE